MTTARRKESLLEALGRVPDPRGRQGRRYEVASMLALAVCAMACGALDGKTRRGIHGEEIAGVHLVSAFAHQRGIVLGQRAAPGQGRELEAATAVLEDLELKGQIVTRLGGLAQRDICRKIKEKGGSGFSD